MGEPPAACTQAERLFATRNLALASRTKPGRAPVSPTDTSSQRSGCLAAPGYGAAGMQRRRCTLPQPFLCTRSNAVARYGVLVVTGIALRYICCWSMSAWQLGHVRGHYREFV